MFQKKVRTDPVLRLCFGAAMIALIYVANFIRVPFMDTSLHPTNGLCALAGILLGPSMGFVSAGLGSMLYDLYAGYGAECLITLVSKGAIGLLAGLIAGRVLRHARLSAADVLRVILGCVVGSLAYVALYMLKTWLFGLYVNGLTAEATLVKMGTKLPGSLLNAVFAMLIGPALAIALRPALRHTGLLEKM